MIKDLKKFLLATSAGGFGMWITAGLWHNLVLPQINRDILRRPESLGLMLVAYFILAGLMTHMYALLQKNNKHLIVGLRVGVVINVLWVFPHGLAMAGAQGTSVGH